MSNSVDYSNVSAGRENAIRVAATERQAQKTALKTTLTRGLVREVVYSPLDYDIKGHEEGSSGFEFRNIKRLKELSRNTIFVSLLSEPDQPLWISPPLLPSHLQLPVKPGEHVWLIQEGDDRYYWLSRIPGVINAEDPNFTHADRQYLEPTELSAKDKAEITDNANLLPTFNDSTEQEGSKALKAEETYQDIMDTAEGNNFRMEPVPQLCKRPGDLVLQGSNNTAIILGEKRGWKKENTSMLTTNSSFDPGEFSGTIDIVVGRGRTIASETTAAAPGSAPDRTSCPTIENDLGKIEADKNPVINSATKNPWEGDPDFWKDAARVYTSTKATPDTEFSLDASKPAPFTGEYANPSDESAVVTKADHIRIIARKDDDDGINGTIRIIKEGDPSDDAAAILMESSGIVHIAGSEIYLGRKNNPDGGEGGGPAEGSSQPYVKYQQLENLITAILDDISAFCDTVNTHQTPGFGAPSPQLLEAAATLKTATATRKSEIPNIKSKRIFGE